MKVKFNKNEKETLTSYENDEWVDIPNMKNEINYYSRLLSECKFQIVTLENEIANKKEKIKSQKDWLCYLKSKSDEISNKINEKQKIFNELN